MNKNARFYKWNDNNELQEFKILGFQNGDIIKIKWTKGDKKDIKEKVDKNIIKEYTELKPDAVISFLIVNLRNDLRDVVITVSKSTDIQNGATLPSIVCRQCIVDIFASQFSNTKKEYYGLSISTDSCPAGVDFENFLVCDGIEYIETVSYYIGDTLENITENITERKYNDVLSILFMDHCKSVSNGFTFSYKSNIEKKNLDGYCKTVYDLLDINNFMYDIYHAFNIIPLNLDLSSFEGDAAPNDCTSALSRFLCVNITKSLLLKYDKDIDLNKISTNYQLIVDSNYVVYVLVYKHQGIYHVPVEDVENEENIIKLNERINTRSLRDAVSVLMIQKNKYNDIL